MTDRGARRRIFDEIQGAKTAATVLKIRLLLDASRKITGDFSAVPRLPHEILQRDEERAPLSGAERLEAAAVDHELLGGLLEGRAEGVGRSSCPLISSRATW